MVASKKTSEIVVSNYFIWKKYQKNLLTTIAYEKNIENICFDYFTLRPGLPATKPKIPQCPNSIKLIAFLQVFDSQYIKV